MSADRRETQRVPEITFAEFLDICRIGCAVRIQGKVESATKASGRLVRFNRAVLVDAESVRTTAAGHPTVRAERLQRTRDGGWRRTGVFMTVSWKLLDWFTPQAGGDPNGTWVKVTHVE
jgi:hypothetical protein